MTIKDELYPKIKVDARLAHDGTLWVKMSQENLKKVGRIIAESGIWCKQFYVDADMREESDEQVVDEPVPKIEEVEE